MYCVGDSLGSLIPARSRATSSTTLLSEVISLKRFRSHKHTRLAEHDNEDDDEDEFEDSVESLREEDGKKDLFTTAHKEAKVTVADTIMELDIEPRPKSLDVSQQRLSKITSDTPKIHKPHRKYQSPVSPVAEKPELADEDDDSLKRKVVVGNNSMRHSNGVKPSVSSSVSSSLTNALSSPASSLRSTNPKETKEKRNRERLLAGSEFSLAGPDTDLEMDYYDYNVSNASKVPGSYLGMDPAFCVWIPPFAPGRWNDEEDDRLLGLSDNEDTELKDLSKLNERTVKEYLGDGNEATTEFSEKVRDNASGSATPINIVHDIDAKSEKSFHDCYSLNRFSQSSDVGHSVHCNDELPYQMVQKLVPDSPVKVHRAYRIKEKEIRVEKSPSDDSEYYDLLDDEDDTDIKFADEDEDDEVDKNGNVESIISSAQSNNKRSYY